jgi:hypothetical protein
MDVTVPNPFGVAFSWTNADWPYAVYVNDCRVPAHWAEEHFGPHNERWSYVLLCLAVQSPAPEHCRAEFQKGLGERAVEALFCFRDPNDAFHFKLRWDTPKP